MRSGGADAGHAVELRTARETRSVRLYDRPGDDYLSHKGDLWKIAISNFKFTNLCITVPELQGIAITERSNDGWHIDSIATFLKTGSKYLLFSKDFDVNRWIDGNSHFSRLRFDLTVKVFDSPASNYAPLESANFNLGKCSKNQPRFAFTLSFLS